MEDKKSGLENEIKEKKEIKKFLGRLSTGLIIESGGLASVVYGIVSMARAEMETTKIEDIDPGHFKYFNEGQYYMFEFADKILSGNPSVAYIFGGLAGVYIGSFVLYGKIYPSLFLK